MNSSNLEKIAIKGASGALMINILGLLLGLAVQVYLARVLGAQGYGAYSYVISWMSVLVIVSSWGMEGVAFRHAAAYLSTFQFGLLKGLIVRGGELVLYISLLIALTVFAVSYFLPSIIPHNLSYAMALGCLLLPIWALSNFKQSTLASFKVTVFARLPDMIVKQVMLIVFIIFLMFSNPIIFSAEVVLILHILSAFIALIISSVFLNFKQPESLQKIQSQFQTKEWIKTGTSLMLISLIYVAISQFDTIMIGIIKDTESVGIYSVSNRISQFVAFGLQAIALIAAPMISELYASSRFSELEKFVLTVSRWLFISAFPILLFIIFTGEYILKIFGSGYSNGYWILVILAISQFVNATMGAAGYLLTMSGNQKLVINILLKGLFVNILLNIPLIYLYDAIGAALATCVTTIVINVLLVFKVKKLMNFNPTVFGKIHQ